MIEVSVRDNTVTRSDVPQEESVVALDENMVIGNSMGIRLPASGGIGSYFYLFTAFAVTGVVYFRRRKRI